MSFQNLSNTHLISNFSNLVQQERKITAQVLECIAEIDRRKIYLEKGHSSLFDYLVKDHGYSPGAAMRRIDGARLLRELPEVKEKIESGALTLSQVNQIQRAAREMKKTDAHMSTEEKQDLIQQVEHASKKETEKIIALALDLPVVPMQKETLHRDESVTLTLTFSKEQMEMLEQVRGMTSHCLQDLTWAEVFSYLAQKELSRRTQIKEKAPSSQLNIPNSKTSKKRVQRNAIPIASCKTSLQDSLPLNVAVVVEREVPSMPLKSDEKFSRSDGRSHRSHRRRAIPAAIRKTLLHANAKCEYKTPQGKLCNSTHYLQIDHLKSVSRGGGNELKNLQVLCGFHNRHKYLVGG